MAPIISKERERHIRDLTVEEFRKLIKQSIAEDMTEWRETFEILSDRELMRQVRAADKSRREGQKSDFLPWERNSR